MKTICLFYLSFLIFQYSGIFLIRKDSFGQQAQYQLSIPKYLKLETSDYKNLPDFSNLEISEDSLDIKLFELIENSAEIAEDVLLKNIDNLIDKGAKPDALVQITYSVRKPGTYIPIVKEFYNNKYREYTTATTAVHAAAGCGKVAVMKKLVSNGANLNIANADKTYPIDIALKANDVQMIECMIEAKVDLRNSNLAMSENVDLIEKLVKLGANSKTINVNFSLQDKSALKRLLALKPALNDEELDFSIIMVNNELFDLLISNGLSANAQGKFPDACPAIIAAIKYDNFVIFNKLYNLGADLNVNCKAGFGETPLQTAIYYQRIEMLKFLLDHKVNPNEKDWTKKSVLYKACDTDNDQIINMLIDAGANIENQEYFDKTPLMEAANSGKYISAQALINRKANINFKNKYEETPLVLAIKHNDFAMIKLLVENGADAKLTSQSKTMVQLAQENSAPHMIIEYLNNH